MARPLRIEYPGAFYHVMNRGNRRQTVFESESDVKLFLDKLGEFSLSYHIYPDLSRIIFLIAIYYGYFKAILMLHITINPP